MPLWPARRVQRDQLPAVQADWTSDRGATARQAPPRDARTSLGGCFPTETSTAMLPVMLLALRVPAGNDRGPLYAEQALAALHQGNPQRLPVTLVLTRHQGQAGLFLRCPDSLRALVAGQLYAAYPTSDLDRLAEDAFAPPPGTCCWSLELTLHPDLFPIKRHAQFEDALARVTADPLTALLTTVSREQRHGFAAAVEISLKPTRHRHREKARRLLRRLTRPLFRRHERLGEWYLHAARSHRLSLRLLAVVLGRLGKKEHDPHGEAVLHVSSGRLHEREDRLQAAADKLGRLLFDATIRLTVQGPPQRAEEARQKLQEMAGAFGLFAGPGLAEFHATAAYRLRRPRPFLLSSEEVASLWHPPTATVQAETLAIVESRELEPPVTLPTRRVRPEVPVFGVARFRGHEERFGILPDDRRRHILLQGKTGMGKTTLLQQLLGADIHAGQGVGLIDPHGDLADAVLARIPSHRTNDVVLFDVSDTNHPLAFNVLQCRQPGERPLVASGVLSAFKKLYGDSWGPRLEHILRNCLLTLLEVPGTSLLSVLRILNDTTYRKSVLGRISDPVVRAFWEHEFAAWPAKFQAEAIAPIQNKVGHFISQPLLRNILGQARSTLDLRRVLDQGQILIVNLSKGKIGDDASALLGALLVTSLQLAAMSRADLPEPQRRDFHLFVDEFQNFATDSFATILSEARKYRLSLTLANQYLSQMDEATLNAVFGNVGTLVCFQVGAQDATVLAEQLGAEVQAADLLRLPRYRAYLRLLIDGQPSRPFSMLTLPPQLVKTDFHRPLTIRRYSRQRYGRPLAQVEREITVALTA